MSVLDILAKKGIIAEKDVLTLKKRLDSSSGKSLDDLLAGLGVSEEDVLQSKGEYYDIPVRKVLEADITSKILEYVPEESAVYYGFAPVGVKDGTLEVGMIDPDNLAARDAINFISYSRILDALDHIFNISEPEYGAFNFAWMAPALT